MTRFKKSIQESFLLGAPTSSIIAIQALVVNHTLASLGAHGSYASIINPYFPYRCHSSNTIHDYRTGAHERVLFNHYTSCSHAHLDGIPTGSITRADATYGYTHAYVSFIFTSIHFLVDWQHIFFSLFEIRPKPYGNELRVWKYNEGEDIFEERTDHFKDK